ncbi:UNVERIFIED_CONTAM: hypothetical protein PYX00_001635 [Menopon gallinae]|uniref:Uncharacterized protein n=1 Tax=Menopon gallinae TaxID=328185 RepID=A0AAW2IEW1_9NEOP
MGKEPVDATLDIIGFWTEEGKEPIPKQHTYPLLGRLVDGEKNKNKRVAEAVAARHIVLLVGGCTGDRKSMRSSTLLMDGKTSVDATMVILTHFYKKKEEHQWTAPRDEKTKSAPLTP